MRTCRWCLDVKPDEAFAPSKSYKDGRENRCRACKAQRERSRRYADAGLPVAEARRYPFPPLMWAIGLSPHDLQHSPGSGNAWAPKVAMRFGVTVNVLEHALARGTLRWDRADEMACAAGFHPYDIWDDWFYPQAC